MKIIITESQYKMLLESNNESIQSLIDMSFKSLKERCDEDEYSVLYVENQVHATEQIKVVDVQKTTAKNYLTGKESSSLFVTIDIYMYSIFEHMDFDEMIWELKQECENIIGKHNIRLNLREVINTNTDRQW